MEVALRPHIPTYSGGLGVLAGDTLRSAADLGLPLVGITLVSRAGYLRQEIDFRGRQIEHPDPWDPSEWATLLGAKITVEIEGREVWVRPWLYVLDGGARGKNVPVVLLDTDVEENLAEDRRITHHLYGGDESYRLKQEIVLGIGGVRILQALGLRVRAYHMNEGHSALLAIELSRQYERHRKQITPSGCSFHIAPIRDVCIFTTHTPVEAAHDRFDYKLVKRLLGHSVNQSDLKLLAGADRLNMTRLAANLCGYINGVAKRHAEVSSSSFPDNHVHAITNGIHHITWASTSFTQLYDKHLPAWRHEPELLVRADQIPAEEVWRSHMEAKQTLIRYVKDQDGMQLDADIPILGFARRMTGYKRPELLFSDLDRLLELGRDHPFQLVMAGKAHPRDTHGKEIIETIHNHMGKLGRSIKMVFLPNYDMAIGKLMVAGADIWLNTPMPPMEASGTSGMKAALNGVPNLSVMDGWWIEGHIEGVTGWSIGNGESVENVDSKVLYEKLQNKVLPLYYSDKSAWISVMQGSISKNAYYFNSHRMMRRYATEAYNRCNR
jgi:starch phosphorylase